jgi:hypothetical protein
MRSGLKTSILGLLARSNTSDMSRNEASSRKRRKLSPPEPGPYVLRSVLDDVPLKEDESSEPVYITCVEYWSR